MSAKTAGKKNLNTTSTGEPNSMNFMTLLCQALRVLVATFVRINVVTKDEEMMIDAKFVCPTQNDQVPAVLTKTSPSKASRLG